MKNYKVVIYREPIFSSLIFGSAKINPIKFSDFLNANAKEGWRVVALEKDTYRTLLFFKREAYCVILEMDR